MTDKPSAESTTDGAGWRAVLAEVKRCAYSWEPDVRLLGNVRAADIVRACDEAAATIERLTRELAEAREAIHFAAEAGFEWPADPMPSPTSTQEKENI